MTSKQQDIQQQRDAFPGVIVTTDKAFRQHLVQLFQEDEESVEVRATIEKNFVEIDESDVSQIKGGTPGLVFVDLTQSPEDGINFVEFLVETAPNQTIVAVGEEPGADFLRAVMQAGVTEYLDKPVKLEDLRNALGRIRRKQSRQVGGGASTPGRVLTFFPAKRGDGTTTLAVNTAVEIAQRTDDRVLLIDLDVEMGEDALLLDMEPRFSIVDVVQNFHRVDTGLLTSYIEHHEPSGVDLLAAPDKPVDATDVSGERVLQILGFLKQHYDHIIVDTSGSLVPATIAGIRHADQLYIVSVASVPSIRNITRVLPRLRGLSEGSAENWIRLVINRHDSQEVIQLEEVEETVGMSVFATFCNDYVRVMESVNFGEPVVLEHGSKYADDVRDFVNKALPASIPASSEESEEQQRWYQRLLGKLS